MSVYRDVKGCGLTCLKEILQSQRIYNIWAVFFLALVTNYGYKLTEKPQIPSDNFGPASIYNFELVISLNSVIHVGTKILVVPFCFDL